MGEITFGTDGWRALIGAGFSHDSVRRVAHAVGEAYSRSHPDGVFLVGFDTREGAQEYARTAAAAIASHGLKVRVSDRYLPTPALCWSIAQDPTVCGGVMLTASHNPAEYLGIKLRMSDGGASPVEFSDLVQTFVSDEPLGAEAAFDEVDLVSPYLAHLATSVDVDAVGRSGLRVVLDPMYGAAKGYLAAVMCSIGLRVHEIHSDDDPSFGGLHPEPIPPWTDEASRVLLERGADVAFVNDGDADRIGAIDENGRFVNPHRLFALLISHLVEDLGMTGRVVRTLSGSEFIARQCRRLGLPLTTTPIGFKWIYSEMLEGDVLIGGEESGGIGMPTHVLERDGLLMALLLTQMMAVRGRRLGELVDEMTALLGSLEYDRVDLSVSSDTMESFRARIDVMDGEGVADLAGAEVCRDDGVKFTLGDGSWLLLRPSGTEPLVRVYAESDSRERVAELLRIGRRLVEGT